MVALLLAGGACADDVPSLTTTGDSDSDSAGTSTTDTPTTINPDSTSVGTIGMDSGDTTTEGETTEGMTTGPTTGPDTDGMTTTTDGGPVCGNGEIEAGEDCESEDLGGEDCASQGFTGGTLLCNADCSFDTSMCTSRMCGNGAIEGTEECDGADLGAETCATQGFDGGNLACAGDCSFDTAGCTNITCGDGAVDPGEACDGGALNGETCVTQGFAGGVLACAADCLGFDTSGCMAAPCAHDICVAGELLAPGCDPCVDQICAVDGFCCDTQWDGQCVGEVDTICGIVCPPPPAVCGNDATEAGETCDGTDLAGQDCITQGFPAGGVLACAADCLSYDTAGCNAVGGGDCCAAHAATGCDDAGCQASVCALDAFCCDTSWDATCANEAIADPNCAGVGGSCPGGGGGGDCCAAHAGTGCDNAACEAAICAFDAFCCNNSWDGQCANEAIADPACQGAGGTCPAGAFPCSDESIGNATGAGVAGGNTAGDDEDLQPSCGGAGGLDHVMTWTATVAGDYTFDTFGSAYDTKLALYSDCATQLACNDDSGGAQSLLVQNLAAGQTILIAVDGFGGATGAWTLNITPPAGGGFVCQDQDLGGAIGAAVAAGTTAGADNDLNPSCGAGDAPDQVFRFQAPAAASYTFTTAGSAFDTVMALFSDCATQLACNDDTGGTLQSSLQRNMAAGEVVLILVDGYNGATGNYTLNISSP